MLPHGLVNEGYAPLKSPTLLQKKMTTLEELVAVTNYFLQRHRNKFSHPSSSNLLNLKV